MEGELLESPDLFSRALPSIPRQVDHAIERLAPSFHALMAKMGRQARGAVRFPSFQITTVPAIGISGWLLIVRLFQLLAAFISGAMNGWLLYYLGSKKLGPSNIMVALEILVATIFVYELASMLVIHTRQRSRRPTWMMGSITVDVVFCFVDVAIVSLLAFMGLPSNCSGLTSAIFLNGERPSVTPIGYTTIGFSNEQRGHKGELDPYCSMERGFYICAVLTILGFLLTIILSVLRIGETTTTRNSEIQYLLDEREEILKLELKIQEQEVRAHHQHHLNHHGSHVSRSSPPAGQQKRPQPPPAIPLQDLGPGRLKRGADERGSSGSSSGSRGGPAYVVPPRRGSSSSSRGTTRHTRTRSTTTAVLPGPGDAPSAGPVLPRTSKRPGGGRSVAARRLSGGAGLVVLPSIPEQRSSSSSSSSLSSLSSFWSLSSSDSGAEDGGDAVGMQTHLGVAPGGSRFSGGGGVAGSRGDVGREEVRVTVQGDLGTARLPPYTPG